MSQKSVYKIVFKHFYEISMRWDYSHWMRAKFSLNLPKVIIQLRVSQST